MIVDSEPYFFIENTHNDLFTGAMWTELHKITLISFYETLIESMMKT